MLNIRRRFHHEWGLLAIVLPLAGCSSSIDQTANAELRRSLGSTTVTAFPTLVRGVEKKYDAASAAQLAEFLDQQKLATTTSSDEHVEIVGDWGMNQSRMFRESAEAFQKHVMEHPLATKYGLLAEYLMGRDGNGEKNAVGIHAYIVNSEGKLAAGVGLNSHHKVFADAKPKTVEDCTRVLIQALRKELRKVE